MRSLIQFIKGLISLFRRLARRLMREILLFLRALFWIIALGGSVYVVRVVLPDLIKTLGEFNQGVELFVGLDVEETRRVCQQLETREEWYRVEADSTAIRVDEANVSILRWEMAKMGFPRSGRLRYGVFGDTTMSVREVLSQDENRRALQAELEETFLTIDGLRRVTVRVRVPETRLYIEEQDPITISVVLGFESETRWEEEEFAAMVHLMRVSVEGVTEEDVFIEDSFGNVLSAEKEADALEGHNQLLLQQQVERALERLAQQTLGKVIGKDRTRVRVHAALNFSPADSLVSPANGHVDRMLRGRATIERLSVALTIDETKVVIDSSSGDFIEEQRPDEEISQLADLLLDVVVFSGERGDQVTVFPMPFDKTQELRGRQAAEAEQQKEFWTSIAINTAKILGILAALITLRFIIQAIGRGVGVEEELSALKGIPDLDEDDESFRTRKEKIEEEYQKTALLTEYGKELAAARQMQMGLMPTKGPRIDGLNVAGSCRPATHVGGDFFQYLQMDDSRWVICLADVTGHGMEAAIPVVMFSGVLKGLVEEGRDMDDLLYNLNNTMHGSLTGNTLTGRTFVCFSGGELDVPTRTLRLSNAGCPFPFHYRASTRDVVELELEGYPLGVRPDHHYKLLEVSLEVGDRVVLCTDGIVEAEDRAGHMFGFERTSYAIREGCRRGLSADELAEFIPDEVRSFTGDVDQQDDQTVVAIEVKG